MSNEYKQPTDFERGKCRIAVVKNTNDDDLRDAPEQSQQEVPNDHADREADLRKATR